MAPLTVVSFVFNCQFVEIMGGVSDVFVFPQARRSQDGEETHVFGSKMARSRTSEGFGLWRAKRDTTCLWAPCQHGTLCCLSHGVSWENKSMVGDPLLDHH